MAKYLVTGGAGFIGAHLAEALVAEGHAVAVLDDLSGGTPRFLPAGVQLYIGDVAKPKDVEQALNHVAGVFHLGAIPSVQRSLEEIRYTHRTNHTGTVTVLEAALHKRIPVVYASSAAIYGDQPTLPIAEHFAPQPLSPYAADKLGSEYHAAVLRAAFALPTLGLRFFNVYGPRQNSRSAYSGVISKFAERLAQKKEIVLYGDGGQTRDFVYVGDVVLALQRAMRLLEEKGCAAPPLMNIATAQQVSILKLAETMMQVWQVAVPVVLEEARAADIRHSCGDNRLAMEHLAITHWTELEEGLRLLRSALQLPTE